MSQEPLKEIEMLQKQQIIVSLGIDKRSEWCNSFAMVPKTNGKVHMYLDPARLNKALIRPLHRGPYASSDYYNLILDERLSYLNILVPLVDIDT